MVTHTLTRSCALCFLWVKYVDLASLVIGWPRPQLNYYGHAHNSTIMATPTTQLLWPRQAQIDLIRALYVSYGFGM